MKKPRAKVLLKKWQKDRRQDFIREMTLDEQLLDKYEQRFEMELSLNTTQTAHSRQLVSDLMDEIRLREVER